MVTDNPDITLKQLREERVRGCCRLRKINQHGLLMIVQDVERGEIAVGDVCLVEQSNVSDDLLKKSGQVFGRSGDETWGRRAATNEFFHEDVVLDSDGCWRGDARFACEQQVAVFALSPGKDDFTAVLQQAGEARVKFDIIVHAVEVARFQTVDLDCDIGAGSRFRGEDVAFLADGNGAFEALKMAFAGELEQGFYGKAVEHAVLGLEFFAWFCHILFIVRTV